MLLLKQSRFEPRQILRIVHRGCTFIVSCIWIQCSGDQIASWGKHATTPACSQGRCPRAGRHEVMPKAGCLPFMRIQAELGGGVGGVWGGGGGGGGGREGERAGRGLGMQHFPDSRFLPCAHPARASQGTEGRAPGLRAGAPLSPAPGAAVLACSCRSSCWQGCMGVLQGLVQTADGRLGLQHLPPQANQLRFLLTQLELLGLGVLLLASVLRLSLPAW